MPDSEQDLWQLAETARLFSAAARVRLAAKYHAKRGEQPASAADVAHWLVRKRVITPYQAKVLLAGRPGPFAFGKYLVTDKIGQGRLAGLFRAIHRPTNCPVLLEFLKSPRPGSPEWKQIAARAAKFAEQAETRLVRNYELVHHTPYAFAVHESLRGAAAAESIAAERSPADACAFAREAALALDELHSAGLVHGRVSPENLWLDEQLGPKLLWLPPPSAGTPADDVRGLARLLRSLLGPSEPPELARVLNWLTPADAAATPTAREAAAALLPLSSALPAAAQRSRRRAAYVAWLAEHRGGGRKKSSPGPAAQAEQDPPLETPIAAAPPIDIRIQSPGPLASPRTRRAPASSTPLLVSFGVTAVLALVAATVVWSFWPSQGSQRPRQNDVAATPPKPAATSQPETPTAPETAADDGASLWASPTAGKPLDVGLLGAGAQLLLAVRPAELWANPEGERLVGSVETLGFDPAGWLESVTGLPVSELESVLLAVYAREEGAIEVSFVVRTHAAIPDLASRWPGAQASPVTNGTVYQTEGWSYFVPRAPERTFAVAKLPLLREIAAATESPPLRRELEGLLQATDRDRQVTLVAAPAYFFLAGQGVFEGSAAGLELPLRQFLGEALSAVALSIHLHDEDLFVELRAVGRADARARALAGELAARLQALPNQVKDAVHTANLSPYSREVLLDLPRMIEELAAYTRSDTEQGQAVLRAYLPARAAHNLALGGGLLALETGRAAGSAVPARPAARPLAERLQQPISLVFPRETLETALQQWGEAAEVKIAIQGSDLEAESITRNQSFGLDLNQKPAEEVLRKILLLASPEGKLVYVIKAAGPGEDSPSLIVTTRAAAERRGEPIPAALQKPR